MKLWSFTGVSFKNTLYDFFRLGDINGHNLASLLFFLFLNNTIIIIMKEGGLKTDSPNNKKTAILLSQFLFKQTRRIEKASNGFSKKKKKG